MVSRSAGPASQSIMTRELKVHDPLPERPRESRLICLKLDHREDPTLIADRLVPYDKFTSSR